MITIPIQDTPHHIFRLELEGIELVWRFDYYTRSQDWYLGLYDEDGVAIRTGRRLSPGWNPLLRVKDTRLQALEGGALYFASLLGPPGRDAIADGDAKLVWFDADEVTALRAALPASEPILIEEA